MRYVDYGLVENVPVVHVYPMLLCEEVPQLCMPCHLNAVIPVSQHRRMRSWLRPLNRRHLKTFLEGKMGYLSVRGFHFLFHRDGITFSYESIQYTLHYFL